MTGPVSELIDHTLHIFAAVALIIVTMFKNVYRVSQEEWTKLRERVPYVKIYQYNPKHLYP
jgi:hypothetical protein